MSPIQISEHPWRRAIAQEVHARPIEVVPVAGRVRRVATLFASTAAGEKNAQDQFAAWCLASGIAAPRSRQHTYSVGAYKITWELHTEFATLTWTTEQPDGESAWPQGIGLEALASHALIMATLIDIMPDKVLPEVLAPTFRPIGRSVSNIEGGRAQIATDFTLDQDGFTRIDFAAGGLSETRRAIVVRRLLEIETYRAFSLLGLPLARELTPQLTAAEAKLSAELETMAKVDTIEASHASLDTLHALSVATGTLGEKTGYRFAASFAYSDLLHLRLQRLREQAVADASTFEGYLINRIDPAIATCRAFEKRQAALTSKLDRAIGLLNTRIGLDIQIQHRSVLKSISDTGRSQYRLQSTVEGLSAIAISYYALGILSYILNGVGEVTHLPEALAVALAAPLVVVLVVIALRWIQRRHVP